MPLRALARLFGRPFRQLLRRPTVEQLETRDTPSSFDLGAATPFNGFVLGDFQAQSSDTEGRLAVGGGATLTSYGVGDKLDNSHGGRDDLIVGGDLTFTNGQVFNGNAAAGGAANLSSVGLPNGTLKNTVTVDFAAASPDLAGRAAAWGSLAATGTVTNDWDTLRLTGTETGLNVFTLWAGQLATAKGLEVNVPAGSRALVNVRGNGVTMQNFAVWLTGPAPADVLFNFYQANRLTVRHLGLPASALAPGADVTFDNGQITGTLVAQSFAGTGQLNFVPPSPELLPPPALTASLGGQVMVRQQDGSLAPLGNVTLTLSGPATAQTQTGDDGFYSFPDLPAGEYMVTVTEPEGYLFDSAHPGSLGGDPDTDAIIHIPVQSGDNGVGYDFIFRLNDHIF